MKYQKQLADSVAVLKETGVDTSVQEALLGDITENLKEMYTAIGVLAADEEKAKSMDEDAEKQARYYHDIIFADMNAVREPADKLEMLVAKEDWPMPSYGDLIFEV